MVTLQRHLDAFLCRLADAMLHPLPRHFHGPQLAGLAAKLVLSSQIHQSTRLTQGVTKHNVEARTTSIQPSQASAAQPTAVIPKFLSPSSGLLVGA